MSLILTQNDTAPGLTGVLKDGKVPTNLGGATVVAHIRRPDLTVVTKAVTVTDAPSGEWTLTWAVGDLAQLGTYRLELQVTFFDGTIQTFAFDEHGNRVQFVVRAEAA